MDKEEIITLFKLENERELFKQATTPPSCGGGKEFKSLALEGDRILDQVFEEILREKGIIDTGILASLRGSFHNEETLSNLGHHLSVSSLMRPLDATHNILNNDVKEALEALLAATYQVHGLEICKEIVGFLFDTVSNMNLQKINYKGILLEKNDQVSDFEEVEILEPIRLGGDDHTPLFECEIQGKYKNKKHSVRSSYFPKKSQAEQDAARLFLELEPNFPRSNYALLFSHQSTEIIHGATQSILDKEIIFSKPEKDTLFKDKMHLTSESGESLIDWFIRKSIKNPFGALLLLSARLPEVSGSAWSASIEQGELILLNVQIEDEHFFEISFSSSKTKARKDAARRIINSSRILEWLDKNKAKELL